MKETIVHCDKKGCKKTTTPENFIKDGFYTCIDGEYCSHHYAEYQELKLRQEKELKDWLNE